MKTELQVYNKSFDKQTNETMSGNEKRKIWRGLLCIVMICGSLVLFTRDEAGDRYTYSNILQSKSFSSGDLSLRISNSRGKVSNVFNLTSLVSHNKSKKIAKDGSFPKNKKLKILIVSRARTGSTLLKTSINSLFEDGLGLKTFTLHEPEQWWVFKHVYKFSKGANSDENIFLENMFSCNIVSPFIQKSQKRIFNHAGCSRGKSNTHANCNLYEMESKCKSSNVIIIKSIHVEYNQLLFNQSDTIKYVILVRNPFDQIESILSDIANANSNTTLSQRVCNICINYYNNTVAKLINDQNYDTKSIKYNSFANRDTFEDEMNRLLRFFNYSNNSYDSVYANLSKFYQQYKDEKFLIDCQNAKKINTKKFATVRCVDQRLKRKEKHLLIQSQKDFNSLTSFQACRQYINAFDFDAPFFNTTKNTSNKSLSTNH